MTETNLVLTIGTYSDAAAAKTDLAAVQDAAKQEQNFSIVGSVLLNKDADGKVHVQEKGHPNPVAEGTEVGTVSGVIVGLFSPPLLLTTVVGAGLGAVVGDLVKIHKEHKFDAQADEYLPNNSYVVAILADEHYTDQIKAALGKADKKLTRVVNPQDAMKIEKAIDASADDIEKAFNK